MATHVQNKCEHCSSTRVFIIQIVLSVLGAFFTLLVLFLTGWRNVFPNNPVHNCWDAVKKKAIGSCVGCWENGSKKFRISQEEWKLIIQLFKIFFANFQVISTFDFKVKLPPILQASIRTLSNLGNILIFRPQAKIVTTLWKETYLKLT